MRYRLYRHPLVLFGIGPIYVFLLESRLPIGFVRTGWTPWGSTMTTNLAVAITAGRLMWAFGIWPFLLVHLPIVMLGAAAGVSLFYVQHQFEETHWAGNEGWEFHEAALHGSSHYDLPGILRWFTANIGVHHVHHLCSRIPYYRLPPAGSPARPPGTARHRATDPLAEFRMCAADVVGRPAAAADLVPGNAGALRIAAETTVPSPATGDGGKSLWVATRVTGGRIADGLGRCRR